MIRLSHIFLFAILIHGALPCSLFSQVVNEVQICAQDAQQGTGISGALITLTTDQVIYQEKTGGDGCATFRGNIPVSTESELVPFREGVSAPFPNPASDSFKIWAPISDQHQYQFEIFDLLGRSLTVPNRLNRLGNGYEVDVDIHALPEGVYLYSLITDSGVATGSVVKAPINSGRISARGAARLTNHSLNTPSISSMNSIVRIEISRRGFTSIVDERVVQDGEVVTLSLMREGQGRVPLIDLVGGLYLGQYEGGLYPGGNEMPPAHLAEGIARAKTIEPLNINGQPDPDGKIVFTSIGMSTTSSMFCGVADPNDSCKKGSLMDTIQQDDDVNHRDVVLIDGADPGKVAEDWVVPSSKAFNRIEDEELLPFGLSELQVQVAWVNLASTHPTTSLPDLEADAYLLEKQFGDAIRAMKSRYPNLKIVLFSSRVYGGYATSEINPEPYAYEAGFAVKWAVEAQIKQMHEAGNPVDSEAGNLDYNSVAPWVAWGPYLWADGMNPRSDGLVWRPDDLKGDGTHMARLGIEKVSGIMMDFVKSSPVTKCWILKNGVCE